MTLGTRIRELRLTYGWSGRALAKQAGLHFSTLDDIETGRTSHPRIDHVVGLAHALGISVGHLVEPVTPQEKATLAFRAYIQAWERLNPEQRLILVSVVKGVVDSLTELAEAEAS